MGNVLLLVHRMPYPPDKGDKVRSFHVLRHLQRDHRVFLGTFIDTHDDDQHLPALRALCPDMHVERLHPRLAKWRSLAAGLLRREALTMAYYRHSGMRHWVQRVQAEHPIQASLVVNSAMAPYAEALLPQVPMLVDFVDVDSAKWREYAARHAWPMSWLYRREARRLLQSERRIAARARRAFFTTPAEVQLFRGLAPECADRVESVNNGVDTAYFAPDPTRANPFRPDEQAVVFVGAMDYWPNVDGAAWFAQAVLPRLLQRCPDARFHIVGRNPSPAVQRLAGERVVVAGAVPDVRPYLQHAASVVVPLRVARGIQNKLLEALSMARPVVTVPPCAKAVGVGEAGAEWLRVASDPQAFADAVCGQLEAPAAAAAMGQAARAHVQAHFRWDVHLQGLDPYLPGPEAGESA